MKRLIFLTIIAFVSLPGLTNAQALPDFEEANEITIQAGTKTDDLVFVPNNLHFRSGELYKLVVQNPSSLTHNLMVGELGKAGLTTNVEIMKTDLAIQAQRVLEYVTAFPYKTQAVEIKPGETAVWYFMPIREGTYSFNCVTRMDRSAGKQGTHSSAGMHGTIEVM